MIGQSLHILQVARGWILRPDMDHCLASRAVWQLTLAEKPIRKIGIKRLRRHDPIDLVSFMQMS